MRSVNLLSIIQAFKSLDKVQFSKMMCYYGIDTKKGIRDYELNCIEVLVDELVNDIDNISVVDNYYIGFSIPQIGKEFDLLRFGKDNIINVELKTDSTIEKIHQQQVRNYYYLKFLGKEINIFTFVSNARKLYKLVVDSNNSETIEVTIDELFNKLLSQNVETYNNINELFNPSDYLVSPFNSTEKFINGNYFLTVQQENIFHDIQKKLQDSTTNFIALTGSAGTGKTLLTYHIAKHYMDVGRRVLVLHCAQLNKGHNVLKCNYGWKIDMPRYAPSFNDYDIIIIDEAQRMYPTQFVKFIKSIKELNKKCIFSYDAKQYLSKQEKNYDITNKIETELKCTPFSLTDKIRTNKEIAYFIMQLLNKNKNIPGMKYPNIDFVYFKDYSMAKSYLDMKFNKGWKVPNYTPGIHSNFAYQRYTSIDNDCAHSIIGQEYMNVVVVLDDSFKYSDTGELVANNAYYSQKQMLYQIITRAIKKLNIVIIKNTNMLERCIEILS